MTRTAVSIMSLLAVILASAGCGNAKVNPRLEGRVVSHVDQYGSGTSSETTLSADGSMVSGFEYGDPAKPDWTSDIKWSFVRSDGGSEVYRIEWTFRPKGGIGETKTKEVAFDGTSAVRVFENQWQTISIEPGPMEENPR